MIFSVIHKITSILNEGLKNRFKFKHDIVKIQSFDTKNREGGISIAVVNLERDTAGGITFGRKAISDKYSSKGNPSWNINLYLAIAALYPPEKYSESIKLITQVLSLIQANYVITLEETGQLFTVEPVNMSFQELSNLWGIMGSSYMPSLVCKVKTFSIDSDTILQIDTQIEEPEIQL